VSLTERERSIGILFSGGVVKVTLKPCVGFATCSDQTAFHFLGLLLKLLLKPCVGFATCSDQTASQKSQWGL
jgi:hypothetical protein